MPKTGKQSKAAFGKGGKPKAQRNRNDDAGKKKNKHVDPCVPKEVNEAISALAQEIEKFNENENDPTLPVAQVQPRKPHRQRHKKGNAVACKPGTTLKQALSMTNNAQQQPTKDVSHPSSEGDDDDDDEGGRDGSAEDYSDTANERATEYRKGGYHPVVVGEVYNNRYRIVRKLGWGYFSTVWLVWDYKEERYQAMKVQKSAKHYTEAAYDEIKLLGEIMSADPEKTRCCARLNDYFEHVGPNGNHVCMTFDVYGEDLLSLIERYEYRGVPLPIVKCISRQILIGLEHLHALDIIHTDLKPENVLLSTPKHSIISMMKRYQPPDLHQRPRLIERDPKTMTKSQLRRYRKKMRAQEKKDQRNDNDKDEDAKQNERNVNNNDNTNDGIEKTSQSESECVADKTAGNEDKKAETDSQTDSDWEIERLHHVVLADFGNSCWTYRQFTDEVQTRQYRCPEVIIGDPYSTAIDMWSAACMIFELMTGEFLFDPRKGDNYSRDEDHLALITEMLGELPESMRLGDGKYRSQFYNSRGELRNVKDLNFWCLEDILYRKYKFTRKKASEIAEFLLPMLESDPQRRATATEMLLNFESFFEVKEDDYTPFCFVSSDADREQVEASELEEDSEYSSNTDASQSHRTGNDDDADAARYWAENSILSRESLERRGLTILDIQDVLSGKCLGNAARLAAANEVIRILSEEANGRNESYHSDRGDTDYDGDDMDGGEAEEVFSRDESGEVACDSRAT